MKTIFSSAVFAGVVCIPAVLGGCGDDSSSGGGGEGADRHVSVAMFNIGQFEYAQVTLEGGEKAAKDAGDADVTFFDGNFNPQTQLQQCKDAVASGKFQAFVVDPVSTTGIIPCIVEAEDAGIPVVSLVTGIGPDLNATESEVPGVVSQVIATPKDDASAAVEMITGACADKDPCNVVVGIGDAASAYPVEKSKAEIELLEEDSRFKVLGNPVVGYADPAKGYAAGRDILTAYPDVDVIVADTDATVRGIERAVTEAGLDGQVQLVGDGGSEYAHKSIADGRWYGSVMYVPFSEGEKSTELAIAAARGEDVKPYYAIADLNPLGKMTLTKETLDDLEPQYTGE